MLDRYGLSALGVAAGVVLITAGVGFSLDTGWDVERSVVIAATPTDLGPLVGSGSGWVIWAPDDQHSAKATGARAGAGSGFSFSGPQGTGTLTLSRVDAAEGVTYQTVLEGAPAPCGGTVRYEPADEGTRVVWRDQGDYRNKPFGGYMVHFFERGQGAWMERGLARLTVEAERLSVMRQEAEEGAAQDATDAAVQAAEAEAAAIDGVAPVEGAAAEPAPGSDQSTEDAPAPEAPTEDIAVPPAEATP